MYSTITIAASGSSVIYYLTVGGGGSGGASGAVGTGEPEEPGIQVVRAGPAVLTTGSTGAWRGLCGRPQRRARLIALEVHGGTCVIAPFAGSRRPRRRQLQRHACNAVRVPAAARAAITSTAGGQRRIWSERRRPLTGAAAARDTRPALDTGWSCCNIGPGVGGR